MLKAFPGLDQCWKDPSKPDLRTKVKGYLTKVKLKFSDTTGQAPPTRRDSSSSRLSMFRDLNINGIPW